MPKDYVNWGVISCAGIADTSVIPGINSSKNAKLYAISSRSKEKLEEFKGKHNPVKVYNDYESVLSDPDVDAVYIPLPNSMHCEWVIKAAEKKKHILCEKPLGCSVQEVLDMEAACAENGVLLMEAFAYRHSPQTLKVKELVDSGTIGALKLIEAVFYYTADDPDNVRLNKSLGGGATYDIGTYNLNVIRYITGSEPISICAAGETGFESQVDESSYVIMEFEGGIKGISHCSFKEGIKGKYKVVGEKGSIEVPNIYNAKGEVQIIINKAGTSEIITLNCPDNYMLEVEQFGRCILNGEQPLLSLKDSYDNAKLIDRILMQI